MPRKKTKELNNHLILHGWLNDQFGYNTTRELLSDVANFDEGFNSNGYSAICEFLMSREVLKNEFENALPIYDTNIKQHLYEINSKRTQPIVLRYFQYLALLYTEIFLDWKFNRPAEFLYQLNSFVQVQNDRKAPSDPRDTEFKETDLEKLAFWMATGAGKTLIMHINYHQYFHYCKEKLDHVILITPYEGLSEQHIREFENSDIRCERFNIEGSPPSHSHNTIQVIEITKLVEEKIGEGISVPVEAFEGNNLVFVDEGHKGSGSEDQVWRKNRKKVAETGFTFEYSATFGQALAAAKNADLVDEYGKAIVFDYSYRYFYGDGYGKNFRILNVKRDEEAQNEMLFLANLLCFYEQRRYFKENAEAVRDYSLDSPLWAFIGSSVVKNRIKGKVVYTENKKTLSDVLIVIRFLHRFLRNDSNWATDGIEKILEGNSGLVDDDGTDIFRTRLNFLRNFNKTPDQIYRDILNEVFHTSRRGNALHLCNVRNADGEIALKTTHGSKAFGLIFIGDTSAFKKLVESDEAGIETDAEDVLAENLFNNINTLESPINILIGAKKFIEGWDSWRVTAMGLLNIGSKEGSQIIQLFGRGVRLRGKDMSLKRSSAIAGKHPRYISLLETLNIFAVRANFMKQFRDYLDREEVEEPVELTIEIRRNDAYREKLLKLPKVPPYQEGAEGQCEPLRVLTGTIITHTTQSVDIIGSSSQLGIHAKKGEGVIQTHIPETSLALVDWEQIYLQLLEYKSEKGYYNLIFDRTILEEILNPNKPVYELSIMNESEVKPTSLAQLKQLEELVLTLLRKYITKYYLLIQKQWNNDRLLIRGLGEEEDDEKNFPNWTVHVPRNDAQAVQSAIENLKESEDIYGPGLTDLPNVYSEQHLYQPLLTNEEHRYRTISNLEISDNLWRTIPPALEDSERDFVADFTKYIRKHPEVQSNQKEVFLLRNQSRGKGVGFYENEGFFPDFILWILEGKKQRIVFIEPHGMIHEVINEHNDKITLFKRLRALSRERFRGEHVQMDSYVISRTSLSDLIAIYPNEDEDTFAEKWHILFRTQDPNYLTPIFQDIDSS